ncbi:MAG: formylglycine-generating enzyme family protein [Planctomycetota bacterium]|jgi:hypothetical protein
MNTRWKGLYFLVMLAGLCTVSAASADTFGTGANQFALDFVTISGDASSANGTAINQYAPGDYRYKAFSDPRYDYRIGTCEITNDQWDKFEAELGVPVTGDPADAYNQGPDFTGANVPIGNVSWYEAAQFVNWLNTSTGHQAAYKFTGTQGTSTYALDIWGAAEADNGTNFFRHKDAFYFLPTEDEWVKAGYWNGTSLQPYATKPGDTLHQGDGASGTGWNYDYPDGQPWDVGSGSEEVNGTFDMMGNVREWMESHDGNDLGAGSAHGMRGGSFDYLTGLSSSYRTAYSPYFELYNTGLRVASIPEPCSLGLLWLGGLALLKRNRK